MDMTGEYRIPASRQIVWDALNDPAVLKEAIAGCEELERDGDSGFTAKVKAKVGPVSARFSGKVNIVDPDPPNGYRIEGEGTGGAAGFAKGGANVSLAEDGAETVLTYEANASVGGKLAQIGSRLIDGTARKMADDFFAKFSDIVAERAAGAAPAAASAEPADLMEQAKETVADAASDASDVADAVQTSVASAAGTATAAVEQTADAAAEVADTVAEKADEAAAQVEEAAGKGIPSWAWIAGAAVVVVILIAALT